MFRTGLKIAGGLIAVYLVVFYATGAAKNEAALSRGGANVVRAFEGR